MAYRRARTDYPEGVIAIYDNGGRTTDRYTVVYEPENRLGIDIFSWTYMSADPFYPQGVCIHDSGTLRPYSGWGTGSRDKVITFEDLPGSCQRAVRQDLED